MRPDYQRVIDWVDGRIANRPGRVVAATLLLTVVFAVGAMQVSTGPGTERFAEDVPERDAPDAANSEFESPFGAGTTSMQLIHTGENVVSKPGLVRMLTAQYRLERRPDLRIVGATGPANIVAITLDPNATTIEAQLRTVAALAATMRAVGTSLNAFTATVLAITIGLGIAYLVHVVHRFVDEYQNDSRPLSALERTLTGTGGALTGSMLTTVFGIGVLVLAVFPAIGQFGLLTALSVVYAYVASIFVLPSVLVVWARLTGA